MSFGLGHGRELDPGHIAVTPAELPPLPDAIRTDPEAGRVDPRTWFPDPALPLEIEFGSGKGTFLVQQGALQPDTNFLGLEWAGEFFTYAADRVRRAGLENVRMWRGDGVELFRWRMPSAIARVVHLYFPDPWPKTRHHKKRTVRDEFLKECHRVLVPGGELRVVTDHPAYWDWMEDHFARWCDPGGVEGIRFIRGAFETVESAESGEMVGSNFERKYREEGRDFHGAVLRREM